MNSRSDYWNADTKKSERTKSLPIADFKIIAVNFLSLAAIGFFSGTFFTSMAILWYILINFLLVELLYRAESELGRKQIYLGSLVVNSSTFLGLQHSGSIGILDSDNLTAPSTAPFLLGFAFYFLQTVAIQGAVYRRAISRLGFQRYVLAVSFCGSFLAGPLFNQAQLKKIEVMALALPTISRVYRYAHFLIGALLFKFVFANWLSQWVLPSESYSPLLISRSVFCFELQVYFDFAGYSLLSFFLCRIFGIPMYHNFQHPFAAKDIPEFWRRWHIGLGTFFKENIYTPLKSAHPHGMFSRFILPISVFLISAAWHGPTRNFILWGLFHGLSFAITVAVLRRFPRTKLSRMAGMLSMFGVLFYGRLLFMESDFDIPLRKFRRLGMFKELFRELVASLSPIDKVVQGLVANWDSTIIGCGIAAFIAYEMFILSSHSKRCYKYFRPGIWTFVLLLLVLLFFQPTRHSGFVYGR